MADDKQNDDPAPDPWGDLLSDGPEGPAAEFSFSFDEPAEVEPAQPAAGFEAPDFPAAEAEAEPPAERPLAEAAADQQLDDDLVGSWLDDGEAVGGDAVSPATSAEPDAAASASSIEIGTGRSGIVESGEVDAWEDVGPADDQPSGDAAPSGDTFSFDDPAPAEVAEDEAVPFMADAVADEAFPGVDAGLEEAAGAVAGTVVAAAGAAALKPTKARKATPAKKGGLGQIIGLVLGGAMAIPIVLGILVGLMWAGVNVPVGRSIGRALPESIAFIVPEKFRPGYKKPALGGGSGGAGKGSPLDALGTAPPESGGGESSPEPGTGGVDLATVPMEETAGQEPGEPLVDDTPVVPGDGETFEDPLAAAAEPAVKPAAPSPLDNLRAKAAFEQAAAEAAAEAARAERKPLDAAAEQALVAVTALEEVADPEDPARKKLLVELYKSLATVGTELVMLERISADAGRPLAAAPESLAGLHGRLGAHRDDLVRLGRNWLDFAKRPSDGVVLPVTFLSSRKIGPYWSSKVTLPQAKEGVRELVVLSRAEPAAVAGDEIMVTGMVFDGGVVWAADVRQQGRAGGGGFF